MWSQGARVRQDILRATLAAARALPLPLALHPPHRPVSALSAPTRQRRDRRFSMRSASHASAHTLATPADSQTGSIDSRGDADDTAPSGTSGSGSSSKRQRAHAPLDAHRPADSLTSEDPHSACAKRHRPDSADRDEMSQAAAAAAGSEASAPTSGPASAPAPITQVSRGDEGQQRWRSSHIDVHTHPASHRTALTACLVLPLPLPPLLSASPSRVCPSPTWSSASSITCWLRATCSTSRPKCASPAAGCATRYHAASARGQGGDAAVEHARRTHPSTRTT